LIIYFILNLLLLLIVVFMIDWMGLFFLDGMIEASFLLFPFAIFLLETPSGLLSID